MIASRTKILISAGTLIAAGLLIAAYRVIELGFPLFPGEYREVWTIQSKASFRPYEGPVDAQLVLPGELAGWRILEEHFASTGFGFSVLGEAPGPRRARWTRQSLDSPTTLYFKLQVYRQSDAALPPRAVPEVEAPRLEPEQEVAMSRLVTELQQQSSDVTSFTTLLLQAFQPQARNQDVGFLLGTYEDGPLAILLDAFAWAGIPAHQVRGINLQDGRRRQRLGTLVEVWTGDAWRLFDPVSAEAGLPEDFFVWQRGPGTVLDVIGGRDSTLEFALLRNSLPARSLVGMAQRADKHLLLDFSLYSLPVEQQGIFKGLLLIPVAALIVVFMRIVVGVKTSGTFMPILIALAFIQTTLWVGLAIFITLVAVGLWIRSWLSHMNLLLVARISAVIIVVILLMAGLALASYKLGIHQVLSVTFFPTVILAWTIERMSILWEEEGGHEVLVQGSGSLLVALLAYLAMSNSLIVHLTFNFPELLLALLGVILLLGKYTGYRLSELYRFRQLGGGS